MPNEFIIKNGYFSQGNSEITGSLTVTGGITGSLSGVAASSSFAATASYVNPLTQSVFITGSTFINGNLLIDTTSNLNAKLTINGSGLFRNTSDLEWLGVGSIADVHRIMPYSTNVNIRFLSKTNGYASIGAESLSIGSSYAATVAPSNGAIIQGNVSVGSSTNGAKLDVRAQGALSTDTVFRVRDNADNSNIISVLGNGILQHTSVFLTRISTTTNVYTFPRILSETFKMMYSVKFGTDLRGGEYICVQNETTINTIHTFPTEFGDTSGINFTFSISGGNIVVTANVTTGRCDIKLNIQIL